MKSKPKPPPQEDLPPDHPALVAWAEFLQSPVYVVVKKWSVFYYNLDGEFKRVFLWAWQRRDSLPPQPVASPPPVVVASPPPPLKLPETVPAPSPAETAPPPKRGEPGFYANALAEGFALSRVDHLAKIKSLTQEVKMLQNEAAHRSAVRKADTEALTQAIVALLTVRQKEEGVLAEAVDAFVRSVLPGIAFPPPAFSKDSLQVELDRIKAELDEA